MSVDNYHSSARLYRNQDTLRKIDAAMTLTPEKIIRCDFGGMVESRPFATGTVGKNLGGSGPARRHPMGEDRETLSASGKSRFASWHDASSGFGVGRDALLGLFRMLLVLLTAFLVLLADVVNANEATISASRLSRKSPKESERGLVRRPPIAGLNTGISTARNEFHLPNSSSRDEDLANRSKKAAVFVAQKGASPFCENVLDNLKTELAAYSELLKRERENRSLNEEVIEVLQRISRLSEQARSCTGRDLDILNKLQINLVNRLNILVKDKSRSLWREYDELLEMLRVNSSQDEAGDQVMSIIRRLVALQFEIKAMYGQYNMELSKEIARRLEEDERVLKKVLEIYEKARSQNTVKPE